MCQIRKLYSTCGEERARPCGALRPLTGCAGPNRDNGKGRPASFSQGSSELAGPGGHVPAGGLGLGEHLSYLLLLLTTLCCLWSI